MGMTDKTAKERRARGINNNNPKYKARMAANKQSKAMLKRGTHPQMWRKNKHRGAGMRLGPVGALGDDVIIEVRYRFDFSKQIKELSQNTIIGLVTTMIYDPLADYLHEKIKIWAPKARGKLRRSLESTVDHSLTTIDDISTTKPFRVVIGTPDVEYAGPVNKMPTSWLAHNKQPSRWPGITLNDPDAKKEWFNLLRVNGRNKAQRLWSDFLKNGIEPIVRPIAKGLKVGNVGTFAKSLFIVRFK